MESQPGQGTTFRVYLPCAGAPVREEEEAEPTVAPDEAAITEATSRDHETILLVEDDEMFRGLLRQVLEGQGYRVLVAENPAAAMDLVTARGGAIQLLLSDMIMPGGTGVDLASRLAGSHPEMKVVLMSGYTDDALASREADRTTADAFLEKPFATQELLRVIRELLSVKS